MAKLKLRLKTKDTSERTSHESGSASATSDDKFFIYLHCPECGYDTKCTQDNVLSLRCETCGEPFGLEYINKTINEKIKEGTFSSKDKSKIQSIILKMQIASGDLTSLHLLKSNDWPPILLYQPSFASYCPWDKLSGDDWMYLLLNQPIFSHYAGLDPRHKAEHWKKITNEQWKQLASRHPEIFSLYYNLRTGQNVAKCLSDYPGYETYCDFSAIEPKELVNLLLKYPQFVKLCDLSKLPSDNLVDLLIEKTPDLSLANEKTLFNSLSSKQKSDVLISRPQYSDLCDFTRIVAIDAYKVLIKHPELSTKINFAVWDGTTWLQLLEKQPQFADRCDWNAISSLAKTNPSAFTAALIKQSERLFSCSQLTDDKRFSTKGTTCKCPISHLFPLVVAMHWEKHLNWDAVSQLDCWTAFEKYPMLLSYYPFNETNIVQFDWNVYPKWSEIGEVLKKNNLLLQIYQLTTGTNISTILSAHPEWQKFCNWSKLSGAEWTRLILDDSPLAKHCKWDKLSASEWVQVLRYKSDYSTRCAWEKLDGSSLLECLTIDTKFATRFAYKQWNTIVAYIISLPMTERRSVKSVNPKCWEHRLEVLDAANRAEIARLSSEEFYTLIDFMDWEWDSHFSWAALDREQVLEIAKKHPEFLERYGFERISNEEMTQLLIFSPEFADYCLKKSKGNDDVAKKILKLFNHDTLAGLFAVHPELYPKFKPYFSLTLKDRIGFKYYGIDQLRSKVAFYRLFVTQIVMFLFGWIFLYFGECGYKAFSGEHPKEAQTAMYAYVGFALVWSLVQAKLHEYCGKGILSRFLGITQGMFGVILFGYSFFLTNLTRPDYLMAIGIYGVYMLFMLSCHHCVAKKIMSGSWGV